MRASTWPDQLESSLHGRPNALPGHRPRGGVFRHRSGFDCRVCFILPLGQSPTLTTTASYGSGPFQHSEPVPTVITGDPCISQPGVAGPEHGSWYPGGPGEGSGRIQGKCLPRSGLCGLRRSWSVRAELMLRAISMNFFRVSASGTPAAGGIDGRGPGRSPRHLTLCSHADGVHHSSM